MAYYFPRVNTSFTALTRTPVAAEDSNATILFAPLVCSKGPENQLTYVSSIAEFREIFGPVDFKKQGQQVLNVCRWLNAGGIAAIYRMNISGDSSEQAPDVLYSAPKLGIQLIKEDSDTSETTHFGGKKLKAYFTINDQLAYAGSGTSAVKISAGFSLYLVETNSTKKINIQAGTSAYQLESVSVPTTATSIADCISGAAVGSVDATSKKVTKLILTATDGAIIPVDFSSNNNINIYYNDSITISTSGTSSSYQIYKAASTPETVLSPIVPKSAKKAKYDNQNTTYPVKIESKYSGSYYNNIKVIIRPNMVSFNSNLDTTKIDDAKFNIYVYYGDTQQLEYFNNLTVNTLDKFNRISNYVKITSLKFDTSYIKTKYMFALTGGTDCVFDDAIVPIATAAALEKPLESRVDVMLDAGYSSEVKLLLLEYFCGKDMLNGDEPIGRDDVTLYLDRYQINYKTDAVPTDVSQYLTFEQTNDGVSFDYFNANVCTQYGKVEDIYSDTAEVNEIYVTPTYAYARLIPYNDVTYGRQVPQAGLTYGKVIEFTWINEVPSDAEKNNYFVDHVNYIEKDSRGYAFMNQLAATKDNTNLDRINNGRVLNKIRRDIQDLTRPYLFEVLDATTLASLSNKLHAYMETWKQNRTLSMYDIEVGADEMNENQINVSLRIRFKPLTEIIDVNIVVL